MDEKFCQAGQTLLDELGIKSKAISDPDAIKQAKNLTGVLPNKKVSDENGEQVGNLFRWWNI